MPKYMIERDLPGAAKLSAEELQSISEKSNKVISRARAGHPLAARATSPTTRSTASTSPPTRTSSRSTPAAEGSRRTASPRWPRSSTRPPASSRSAQRHLVDDPGAQLCDRVVQRAPGSVELLGVPVHAVRAAGAGLVDHRGDQGARHTGARVPGGRRTGPRGSSWAPATTSSGAPRREPGRPASRPCRPRPRTRTCRRAFAARRSNVVRVTVVGQVRRGRSRR